jgi:CHASE2 domain-containing sensor protein
LNRHSRKAAGESWFARQKTALRRVFLHPETLVVLAAIILWTVEFRRIEEQLPILGGIQLGIHRLLTSLNPIPRHVQFVLPVEVDDATFYNAPLNGGTPTNRRFLADVIRQAAAGGAAVIGLDFALRSPAWQAGDLAARADDDRWLADTVAKVISGGTPVVMTTGFVISGPKSWVREPTIFNDYPPQPELVELGPPPKGVRVGFINLPLDVRQIPLRVVAIEPDRISKKEFLSFALQLVDAFEEVRHATKRSKDQPPISQMEENEFVYGYFFPESKFETKVSAGTLVRSGPQSPQQFRDRIVIIGGTWNNSAVGRGPRVDTHPSPVGDMPGLYLHADYVEALLQHAFARPVPEWLSISLEMVLWVLLYWAFHMTPVKQRLALLLILALPMFVAYILLTHWAIYLDAVIPATGFFIHLLGKHYFGLRERAEEKAVKD